MADVIQVSPEFDGWFPRDGRRSIEAMAQLARLDVRKHRKRSLVSACTLRDAEGKPLEVYFKAYARRRHLFDGFARQSLGRVEARNLENFGQLGIRTPKVVAWGARRSLAGLASELSFLITEAVPESLALRDYWAGLDLPLDPVLRQKVIDELATQTRKLHAARFFHQDLKWRNLLVDGDTNVWWIDCPNGYTSGLAPRQRHGRIKDLATLDIVAKERCTEQERLRFVQVYLNEMKVTKNVKSWSKRVVRYRERRFD